MAISTPTNLKLARSQGGPLLLQSNFQYVGSFRLPTGTSELNSYTFGGRCIVCTPNGIAAVAHDWYQKVGEFTIPVPKIVSTVSNLNRASVVQPVNDILAGLRDSISNGGSSTAIGGLLATPNNLVVSDYLTYDADNTQRKSHWNCGWNFAAPSPTGAYQVGPTAESGVIAGYMTWIPQEWQTKLGGPALTGLSNISVISHTSNGPCINTFDPSLLGVTNPVPTTRLISYPPAHQTLGAYGSSHTLTTTAQVKGVVFPDGTSSVLFFGRLGLGPFNYGTGTTNQSLDGTLVPNGNGEKYWYDPAYDGVHGEHAYPYTPYCWAYDANDLVAVKNGTKQYWEIVPYATWQVSFPFGTLDGVITGATYDSTTRRLFISAYTTGYEPLIHVYNVV